MTASVLPSSPAAFAKATWDEVVPYFDDLLERPLDAATVEEWLSAWSRLEELVTEAAAQAMIAYTIDTSDAEKEKDHLRFSTEILPKMEERSVRAGAAVRRPGPQHARSSPPRWPGSGPRSRSSARRTSRSSPSWRS